MSDEMWIAAERHEWMQCMNAVGFIMTMDATVFCIAGLFSMRFAYEVMTHGVRPPTFEICLTGAVFSGVILIGLYYVYRYCMRKYSELEEF